MHTALDYLDEILPHAKPWLKQLQQDLHALAAVDSGILRRLAATADEALGAVSPTASNLAVAWVLAKLCKPFRLLATAALTPRLARAWRRMPVR